MSISRTDAHRPSQIVPAEYDFIDSYQLFISFGRRGCQDEMEGFEDTEVLHQDGPWFNGEPSGDPLKCDVCSTNHRAGGVFFHKPTGEFVKMGRDCADKYSMIANWRKLDGQKKRNADMRAKTRLRLKARDELRKFVEATPANVLKALHGSHYIIKDIRSKVISFSRRGKDVRPLSDKQQALVLKLDERARKDAETASPVIEGKIEITGEILSAKYVDGYYGSTYKMLVRDDRGFKVFGTVPAAIDNNDGVRGLRVTFTATVERSDRDETFGFFKRPTKASVVV